MMMRKMYDRKQLELVCELETRGETRRAKKLRSEVLELQVKLARQFEKNRRKNA